MPKHFEMLDPFLGWRFRIRKCIDHGGSVDGQLRRAIHHGRRVKADHLQDCGNNVGYVMELVTQRTGLIGKTSRIVHDERIANPASVSVLFVELAWRVASHGPTEWVVVKRLRLTNFVHMGKRVFNTNRGTLEVTTLSVAGLRHTYVSSSRQMAS